jgi:hypothetical protein
MSFDKRKELIQKLQEKRNSRIISYITGDRQSRIPVVGMSTQLSAEPQLLIYDQLRKIGKTDRIDLFLYTRGGETDTVLPVVNAIRQFCDSFGVLVPFRAHSAGTLICLGADQVIMGTFGELSPVDPTTGNQFSPVDEINPKTRKGISVEDVISYINLAKDPDKVGVNKEDILEVFRTLSESVQPLALGHVNRVHTHIRLLARKLLKLSRSKKLGDDQITKIVDTLTEQLYSHTHSIGRDEARTILGEQVLLFADDEEDNLMWDLFEEYAELMLLRERFNVKEYMSNDISKEVKVTGAVLESENLSHLFNCTSNIIQHSELPPNFQVQLQAGQPIPLIPGFPVQFSVELIKEGWEINKEGR